MASFAPKKERESVLLMARIDVPGSGSSAGHRVRNLSNDGVCVEYGQRIEKHTQTVVSIGDLEHVPAEVAWARGGFAGMRFLQPVDAQLARKRRPVATEVRAGWMQEIGHAYRR